MELKDTWKKHPLAEAGFVELIPLAWLWPYRGLDVIPKSKSDDLHYVDLELLSNNIKQNGLSEPLIIRVGLKNKKFRLEAGNHRIQVLYEHGIRIVPVTVEICDICGPEAPDAMTVATHNFDTAGDLLITEITAKFMKPSQVFKSLKEQSPT